MSDRVEDVAHGGRANEVAHGERAGEVAHGERAGEVAREAQASESAHGVSPIPRRAIVGAALVALVVAGVLAKMYGLAVSVLLLAAVALVGVVGFVFRTMQSIAEPSDEDVLSDLAPTDADARKLAALRALKDIDYEHALGNLSDEDHADLSARYRAQAKLAMRAVDEERKERRARAEALVAEDLARREREREEEAQQEDEERGEDEGEHEEEIEKETEPKPAKKPTVAVEKRTCAECATENDPDAKFCKACGGAMRGGEG